MMIVPYVIVIIASLILVLLLIPIRIWINTDEGKFMAGWPGLLSIGIRQDEENEVVVNIWLFFVKYSIYPFNKEFRKTRKETTSEKKKQKAKGKVKLPQWSKLKFLTRTFWQIIRKSRLKEFYLNIDTKNVITNSLLFPVFAVFNTKPNVDLNINFTGNFSLILDVRNNLLNFFIIIIRNLIKR
jgi:hypothetical protein